jgi:hypothetical protein
MIQQTLLLCHRLAHFVSFADDPLHERQRNPPAGARTTLHISFVITLKNYC